MVHAWNTPVLCMEYAWNMFVPCMVHTWNTPVLCMEYDCIMHGTCMKTARYTMHGMLSDLNQCLAHYAVNPDFINSGACSSTESWNMHGSCTLCTTGPCYIHAWNNARCSAWNVLKHAWDLHVSGAPFRVGISRMYIYTFTANGTHFIAFWFSILHISTLKLQLWSAPLTWC